MLCSPAARFAVPHVALLVLPLPASPTAPHPLIGEPPSEKLTLPEGLAPVTVAVKRTVVPAVAGFAELTSVVAVATKLVPSAARTAAAASTMPAPHIAVVQSRIVPTG